MSNALFLARCAVALIGFLPLLRAWTANRATSLSHALGWAVCAWAGWSLAAVLGSLDNPGFATARYLALCLTGAAGVAVLGARRPTVAAWNFVVLGLLGVLLLPLVEYGVLGTDPADPLRVVFLSATLAVGIANYVPTRFAPTALLLALACAGQLVTLYRDEPTALDLISQGALALVPWLGWLDARRALPSPRAADRLWRTLRDRFGALWASRGRDQINRAAKNAGLPVVLGWHGFAEPLTPAEEAALLEVVRAVTRRFL